MKFSSSLKFNAVPEWWDEYIAYDALKKYIYQLEKRQSVHRQRYRDNEATEHSALISDVDGHPNSSGDDTDAVFRPLIDKEIDKVSAFYIKQEHELVLAVAELEALVHDEEERGRGDAHWTEDHEHDDEDDDEDDGDEEDDQVAELQPSARANGKDRASRSPSHTRRQSSEESGLEDSLASLPPLATAQLRGSARRGSSSRSPIATRSQGPGGRTMTSRLRDSVMSSGFLSWHGDAPNASTWNAGSHYAQDTRLLFKRKITNLYVSVTSLKSYAEVNQSGFRKILKKYDKVTENNLQGHYLDEVMSNIPPFTASTQNTLQDLLTRVTELYARCVMNGDGEGAEKALRLHQREHVAWERDTVWRTMLTQARGSGPDTDGGAIVEGTPRMVYHEEEKPLVGVPTPLGRFNITKRKVSLLAAVVTGTVLLNVHVVDGSEASRCFAILMFCTILWATEAIPLFVTSLSVPLLLVVLRVIRSSDGKHTPLPTSEAAKYVFSQMFSPTIMLLIGGFTIASALSKTAIDRLLITRVLSLAGTKPRTVLLAFMGVGCFASMWISNVAAPTLCFTLIKPILRTLPPRSTFGPCLILGIALAANIGGQASPISSPQNLIALSAMDPALDWLQWFAVSLPVASISVFLIWLLLLVAYQPSRLPEGLSGLSSAEDGEGNYGAVNTLEIKPIRPSKDPFTKKQMFVSFVCVLTIALWCIEHQIETWVGDMGVIALLPVIAFFSTGVLKKDDFEQFAWTIVFLAMGGIALGRGVTSSGLLDTIGELIRGSVKGLSLYSVVLVLSAIVLVISTFISHTIAAVLLVPIAAELGKNLPGDHGRLLIFITGLICSAGMGMPVSGFPNQTAAAQEDEVGQLYLTNVDFLKNGVPASIIATLVVSTVGYLIMRAIGL